MKIFLVGGAVRDHIMGKVPKDHDFVVVGATPEEMIQRGFQQVGADFPVFLDANGDEFALARTERKSGKGHKGFATEFSPEVTLEDDLMRRDLTINAMAQDITTGEIIDPFGGRKDIENGILRAVSDAFREDPLRVLRVARFAARFDFMVHHETIEMMIDMVESGELDTLTKERVWKEFSRAMEEDHPNRFFRVLGEVDALFTVFPGRLAVLFEETEHDVHPEHGNIARWMHLFWGVSTNAIRDFASMGVPNDIVSIANFVHSFQCMDINSTDDVLRFMKVWKKSPMLEVMRDVLWQQKSGHYLSDESFRRYRDEFASFIRGIHEAVDIGFDDLTIDEQKSLQGAEIGKAIDKLRWERLDKLSSKR